MREFPDTTDGGTSLFRSVIVPGPPDGGEPAAQTYRTKELNLLESPEEITGRHPRKDTDDWGKALACVPVATTGVCHGVLVFSFAEPRRFSDEQKAFLTNIARQGALALERAHYYEEAKRAVRTRDDLLAMAAHDLRSPLTVISVSAAEMLRGSFQAFDQKQLEERAGLLLDNVDRMERLIRDMLDFSVIDAGELTVSTAPAAVVPLLRQAVESYRTRGGTPAVRLDAPDDAHELQVVCDRERLTQILDNLIGNAVKFTDEGGEVTVRCRSKPNEVVVSIEDTGVGIAPQHLPHIFDRFWSGGADENNRNGHGLGLFIVKALVEAQGGRIEAHSTPGEGSTFRFTVPRTGTERPASSPARRRVLLVDDDDAFRHEVREILTGQGFEIAVATNGEEALDWLEDNGPPALVLLDLMMPVMSGWELYTEMQTDPVWASVPVVVVTSADNARVQPLQSQVDACLAKPVGLRELIDTVEQFVAD